jgi:hypothetical protein
MKHTEPTIHANVLALRDLRDRMEHLEDKLAFLLQTKDLEGLTEFFDIGVEEADLDGFVLNDWADSEFEGTEGQELRALKEAFDDIGTCAGQALIQDDHIEDYAIQTFKDGEGVRAENVWPFQFINWGRATGRLPCGLPEDRHWEQGLLDQGIKHKVMEKWIRDGWFIVDGVSGLRLADFTPNEEDSKQDQESWEAICDIAAAALRTASAAPLMSKTLTDVQACLRVLKQHKAFAEGPEFKEGGVCYEAYKSITDTLNKSIIG